MLGIIRDSVMTYFFGRNLVTDAYFCAFQIPDVIFFLISGGALSSAFIPVFTEYLQTGRAKEAWKIYSVVTTIMTVIVSAFIVIAWIGAEPLVHLTSPKLPEEYVPLTVEMSRILLPAQLAFFIGGLMFGTLYARQVFAIPGLGPNIYNIGIIFGAVALGRFFHPGIIGMTWGALIGAWLGNVFLPYFVMRKMGSEFKISFDTSHPGVKKVFQLMLPVILGLSLPAVYGMIMKAFGTGFAPGIVSSVDQANRLMQAPLGIFGQSLAIAIFPALSQFYAQDRMDMYRDQVARSMRQVIYLTVPISVFMIVMAPTIVSALFQHGHFTAADTAITAEILRIFCIGISAWCLHPVLMRAFFAMQNSITPIIIGTITTGIFVILIYALIRTSLGYLALPLAGSLSAIVLVLMMTSVAQSKMGGLDIATVLNSLGQSALASVAVGLVAAIFAFGPVHSFAEHGKVYTLFVLAAGFLACAWTYFGITVKMNMPETATLTRAMNRFSSKLKA